MKTNRRLLLAFSCLICLLACTEKKTNLSLAGQWSFAMDSTNVGISDNWATKAFDQTIQLPGTMDGAGYGEANTLPPSIAKPQILHLTRKHRYIGPAWYSREVTIPSGWEAKEIELSLERVIWHTSVWVDGVAATGDQESLIAPHRFNLSQLLTPGKHRLTIRVDNSKRHDISTNDMGHAYTDHTQIMWNGILGDIALRAYDAVTLRNIQVYPDLANNQIHVKGTLSNSGEATKGNLKLAVQQKNAGQSLSNNLLNIEIPAGETRLNFTHQLGKEVELWSEFTPTVYTLDVALDANGSQSAERVDFGMRQVSREGSNLLVNGHKVFLRGTLECCIFPLTGCPPTTTEGWLPVFQSAREWGLNHLRFHSWCPPRAAFQVADSLGFYLQVELPMWSVTVGNDEGTNEFLRQETDRILSEYGNHPSFCLFSLGNELQPDFVFLGSLLERAKSADSRHLYTTTSFTFERGHGDWPEPNDDFFITQWTRKGWVRGQGVFDVQSPNFNMDYSASVDSLPVPVITHEIGQYAVYPDLKEIEKYTGVLDPLNFKGVKQELEKKGLLDRADAYLMASGKLATLLYKEEIERAMKTPGISGYQLLDLHDFPGQGTALVGLLNAFWESKGVAEAAEFRQFSAPVVPLARFPKAVYSNNETFAATIEIANYGAEPLDGQTLTWSLTDNAGTALQSGSLPLSNVRVGGGNQVGEISCPLSDIKKAEQIYLTTQLEGTPYRNSWKIWVYPANQTINRGDVLVTDNFGAARTALQAGQKVLYNPSYKSCIGLQGKFVPVFWSPVHFPKQAGTMGLLLDPLHKAFAHFPTDGHTDWQWWSLLTQSTTLVTDSIHTQITPLVECVDNFANNRRLSNLFETNCLKGKLVVCSMDLSNHATDPVKRQLLHSLISYMQSDAFAPATTAPIETIQSITTAAAKASDRERPEGIY